MLRSLLCLVALAALAAPAIAQDRPPERVMRTYVPPEDLVSFQADVPLDRFLTTLEPLFERTVGKIAIDPNGRTAPIGVPIQGMHFMDAFNLVLRANNLTFRENERYFVLADAEALAESSVAGAAIRAGNLTGPVGTVRPVQPGLEGAIPNVTSATREIQINAILFEINASEARDKGINWDVLLASEELGLSTAAGDPSFVDVNQQSITVDTDPIFDLFGDVIQGPNNLQTATITNLIRYYERENVGRTLASPQVTVQSGEAGRIQIGTDFPYLTRDFAGNTITQFLQTGIIIDVTPTLFTETVTTGGVEQDLEFVHLAVGIERSSGRVSGGSLPIVDRTRSDTKIVLLDGEQTIIAGLSSTQRSYERRGIPGLKDLPGWFFGLRYIFGYEVSLDEERELVIVLEADVVDTLPERALRPVPDGELFERRREMVEEALRRAGDPDVEVDLEIERKR
jgi:type IV pilus assembly protein PilQ